MTGATGLSRQEQELITSLWTPDIPEGEMTPRVVQRPAEWQFVAACSNALEEGALDYDGQHWAAVGAEP